MSTNEATVEVKPLEEKGVMKGKAEALVAIARSGIITGEQFDQIQNLTNPPPLSLDEEWDIETSSGWNRKDIMLELVDELQERDVSSSAQATWERVRENVKSA